MWSLIKYIYIYIYIERERERRSGLDFFGQTFLFLCFSWGSLVLLLLMNEMEKEHGDHTYKSLRAFSHSSFFSQTLDLYISCLFITVSSTATAKPLPTASPNSLCLNLKKKRKKEKRFMMMSMAVSSRSMRMDGSCRFDFLFFGADLSLLLLLVRRETKGRDTSI